jgi:hypothetical protein
MRRGLFLLILISLMHASFSQNLVVNPGLETWGTSVKPTDWVNTQNCLKDSVFVKSGNYACRQEGVTSSRDLGQRIIVSPGKQYKFSFFFKTGSTTTGNGCRLWCEWLDEAKVSINDPSSVSILHSVYMQSEVWQQFSCSLTSPAGAGYFYLLVRTLSSSITYWDDFVFEESIPTNNTEEQLSEIKIYPNPTHEYLNISNLQDIRCIDIQSLTGATKWASNYTGEENVLIPLSGFPTGLYIIRIRTSTATITKKIIIE